MKNSNLLAKKSFWITIFVVVLLGLVGLGATHLFKDKGVSEDGNTATFKVKRGPLRISISESGTIKAREQEIIKCEVEGRTTILTLVDEGTEVKKGELLIELDSSDMIDRKIEQEISVQSAEADHIRASENYEVQKNQSQSDIDKAELNLKFAEQDLKKYIEGEYPNQLTEAEARITLAEEELARAEETLNWSQKLYGEGYISKTELQGDQLAKNKKQLDLKLEKNKLDLLKNFTNPRKLAELESDVKQNGMALERVRRKARADILQAEADLKAKEVKLKRQQEKYEKVVEQIGKTKIYAPSDGLVVYASSVNQRRYGNNTPLDEGQEVREREELIYLPKAEMKNAEIQIHEADLKKISTGMDVIVTVDALPGREFRGKVRKIAPLPDASNSWLNPDLKVYNTEIEIFGDGSMLKTGMSCKAEIIIEQYEDAVYLPVQAVLKVDGNPTVFVQKGLDFEPVQVNAGLDNNNMIRIIDGLNEGQVVSLNPPLKEAAKIYRGTGQTAEERNGGKEKGKGKGGRKKDKESSESLADVDAEINSLLEKIPAEHRDKIKEKLKNMSAEEKKQMLEKFKQFGGESGSGG